MEVALIPPEIGSSCPGFSPYNLQKAIMATRNLRVTKWLGAVPAVATCTQCGREFKVPLQLLKRATDSQESLRKQFAEHKCPTALAEQEVAEN